MSNTKYDLMFGCLGNGTTVFNKAVEISGDYKKIAHIADYGAITWYEERTPATVKETIINHAFNSLTDELKEKLIETRDTHKTIHKNINGRTPYICYFHYSVYDRNIKDRYGVNFLPIGTDTGKLLKAPDGINTMTVVEKLFKN